MSDKIADKIVGPTPGSIVRLAVQKSGRLSEDSLALLEESGLEFQSLRGGSKLRTAATNFPLEVLFLRDDDIPGYVADGVADIGIVGENVLVESEKKVAVTERLGFSKCRLSLAVPRGTPYSGASDLNGRRIATSYPRILKKFLIDQGVTAEIHEISGSVEIAPGIGVAEVICDIVGSGSTLASNGLVEAESVFHSEAVLIASSLLSAEKSTILERLLFRVRAVKRAKHNKYILLNAPNEALEKILGILPGMKSPSVLPLASSGWSSVHAVLHEDVFWECIEELRAAGAQGILVLPIEKMII